MIGIHEFTLKEKVYKYIITIGYIIIYQLLTHICLLEESQRYEELMLHTLTCTYINL